MSIWTIHLLLSKELICQWSYLPFLIPHSFLSPQTHTHTHTHKHTHSHTPLWRNGNPGNLLFWNRNSLSLRSYVFKKKYKKKKRPAFIFFILFHSNFLCGENSSGSIMSQHCFHHAHILATPRFNAICLNFSFQPLLFSKWPEFKDWKGKEKRNNHGRGKNKPPPRLVLVFTALTHSQMFSL